MNFYEQVATVENQITIEAHRGVELGWPSDVFMLNHELLIGHACYNGTFIRYAKCQPKIHLQHRAVCLRRHSSGCVYVCARAQCTKPIHFLGFTISEVFQSESRTRKWKWKSKWEKKNKKTAVKNLQLKCRLPSIVAMTSTVYQIRTSVAHTVQSVRCTCRSDAPIRQRFNFNAVLHIDAMWPNVSDRWMQWKSVRALLSEHNQMC